MRSNISVTLLGLMISLKLGFALNPIHESSYNLVPATNYNAATTLSTGLYIRSQQTSVFDVPLGLALQVGPRVEVGARVQTRWGDVNSHAPYMVFGVKWLTVRHTSVQADLLVGTQLETGKGFSIGTFYQFDYNSVFFSRLSSRVGFMEALTDEDALMAMEIEFSPGIIIHRFLSLECGLIASSQTTGFERYLAIDAQPSIRIGFLHNSFLETALALGLAGDHKEEMRVKITLIHGI